MFGARRLAKRSIIGTRVSALSAKGGHFYEQGVIQSTLAWPNGEEVYTVSFVDGTTCTLRDADIVGVGFRTVASTQLAHGQRVYITHAGREVSGSIHRASSSSSSQSSSEDDEDDDASTKYVRVRIFSDGGEVTVSRRLEDVRLMPSRKSARLQDQDYNRLADTGTSQPDTPKKRAVSHVIDVPTPPAKYRLVLMSVTRHKYLHPVRKVRVCIVTSVTRHRRPHPVRKVHLCTDVSHAS